MEKVVLFDGVCNLCDASVQFIIKHDPKGKFKFASLQSNYGQRKLKEHSIPTNMNSFVLIENNNIYVKSSAALNVCKNLNGLWKLLFIFIVIPKPLRDVLYDLVATNRYKMFGKKESCLLPKNDLRNRFLDN